MQLLCPYYVKGPHKSNVALTDVWTYVFKFELIESILKQLIKLLFHTFLPLFRSKSQHGCPISSKITKLYFDLNIIQSTIGLRII